MSAVLEFHNSHSTLLLAAGPSMVEQPGAAVQGEEGGMDVRPVPGWAAEDTTSTSADSPPAVVVSCVN